VNPTRAARAVVRTHSTTFYLGSLLLDRRRREATWAVYAACRVGDEAVDGPGAGIAALGAWRDGIGRAYDGRPREPWEEALAGAVSRYPVPRRAFDAMATGFATDLGAVRLPDLASLLRYSYEVAGTVGEMMAAVLGGEEATAEAVALGQAMQLTNCLRDVGEDRARGRIYLPADRMDRYGVAPGDLAGRDPGPGYRLLAAEVAGEARRLYDVGLAGLGALRTGRAAVALAALQYRGILDELERRDWAYSERAALRPGQRLRLLLPALAA